MYLFKGISLISILLSMVSGAPTLSDKIPESFEDALKSIAIDTGKVIQSTSDVIDFIAKKSAEAVSEAGRIATEAAEYALPTVEVITDLTKKISLKNAQEAASATQVAIVEAIGRICLKKTYRINYY